MNTRETRLERSGRWSELGILTKSIPNTSDNKAEKNPRRYKQIETYLNHDGDDAKMI